MLLLQLPVVPVVGQPLLVETGLHPTLWGALRAVLAVLSQQMPMVGLEAEPRRGFRLSMVALRRGLQRLPAWGKLVELRYMVAAVAALAVV